MSSELSEPSAEQAALEAISAFIDGERVDCEELKRALELPEGREYLVDLLTLREAIGGLGPFSAAGGQPARIWRLVRGTAAAAIVLLALAGGYMAGHRVSVPPATSPAAPESQVFVVGSGTAAPRPTQVIKLEPGVNWSDSNGGK